MQTTEPKVHQCEGWVKNSAYRIGGHYNPCQCKASAETADGHFYCKRHVPTVRDTQTWKLVPVETKEVA